MICPHCLQEYTNEEIRLRKAKQELDANPPSELRQMKKKDDIAVKIMLITGLPLMIFFFLTLFNDLKMLEYVLRRPWNVIFLTLVVIGFVSFLLSSWWGYKTGKFIRAYAQKNT